jgi:hypothetical protein
LNSIAYHKQFLILVQQIKHNNETQTLYLNLFIYFHNTTRLKLGQLKFLIGMTGNLHFLICMFNWAEKFSAGAV